MASRFHRNVLLSLGLSLFSAGTVFADDGFRPPVVGKTNSASRTAEVRNRSAAASVKQASFDNEKSSQSSKTAASQPMAKEGEKTAFFGWGCSIGCAPPCNPCRPVCRPVCAPVNYGCPPVYGAPAYGAYNGGYGGYGGGYGGVYAPVSNCAPIGGCAPAGGYYSGPVLPPAISSPVIGVPAAAPAGVGYYGNPGFYGQPGYGQANYYQPGYGQPAYGYPPIYGENRTRENRSRTTGTQTRAVSKFTEDRPGNPFAD